MKDRLQPGRFPCPSCGEVHPVPTEEALEDFYRSQRRVDWGRASDGSPVYTNGIMEDALGLTPVINGWGRDEGYYVTPGIHAKVAAEIVASIDWDRVAEVRCTFDIPFNHGDKPGMMFDDRLLLSDEDYDRALKACFRSVPEADYVALIEELLGDRA